MIKSINKVFHSLHNEINGNIKPNEIVYRIKLTRLLQASHSANNKLSKSEYTIGIPRI